MQEQLSCVLVNSYVFPLHVDCSSLTAHTFQEFPSHGKFLPERQIAIKPRFIFNERQLTLLQNSLQSHEKFSNIQNQGYRLRK